MSIDYKMSNGLSLTIMCILEVQTEHFSVIRPRVQCLSPRQRHAIVVTFSLFSRLLLARTHTNYTYISKLLKHYCKRGILV